MKKISIALLAALITASVLSPAAWAVHAGDIGYEVLATVVNMDEDGKGSFSIKVDGLPDEFVGTKYADANYAGVQIKVELAEGVEFENENGVTCNFADARIIPPQKPISGQDEEIYYFSCFSTENTFTGAMTCTFNLVYTGTDATTVTVMEVMLCRLVGNRTDDYSTNKETEVTLNPFNANPEPTPTEEPEPSPEPTPTEEPEPSPEPTPTEGPEPVVGGNTNYGVVSAPSVIDWADYAAADALGSDEEEIGDDESPPLASVEAPIPVLDKSNEKAYLSGYPDGTFHPDDYITRAETASLIYALVTNDDKADYAEYAARFSDVAADDWYVASVGYFTAAGIVIGYPDSTFMGDQAITRAEFAAILSRFEATGADGDLPFDDVESHWARDEIQIAYSNGWVNGYPDGTFKPDASISRAEAVAMVNRMIGRDLSQYEGYPMKFTDVPEDEWYYMDITAASNDI